MTTFPVEHFSDDVWLDNRLFHCRGQDIDLAAIDEVFVNFRVNSAVCYFLGAIISFFALGYGYFYYGDSGYVMLIPLVACFGMLRYILLHYVELMVVKDGRRERVLVSAMGRREWIYGVEDAVKARMHELNYDARMAD